MIEERSNLKKADAINDWIYYGRPAVMALLDRTGLSVDHAWKLFVRDCHYRPQAKKGAPTRVSGIHENVRRVEVTLQPLGSKYAFEVDLATAQSDPPFSEIVRLLQAACAPRPSTNGKTTETMKPTPPADAPPAPPPPAPREQILAGLDLAKLLKMRDGFDQLITVGKDVQTAAELKREIEAKVAAAEAVAGPLRTRVEAATGYHAASEDTPCASGHTVTLDDRISSRHLHPGPSTIAVALMTVNMVASPCRSHKHFRLCKL